MIRHPLAITAICSQGQPTPVPLPLKEIDVDEISRGSMSVTGDTLVDVWYAGDSIALDDHTAMVKLRLQPHRPIVIGRQDGGPLTYLDPSYISTPLLPQCNRTILKSQGGGRDMYVSRGHFMLRGHPRGIHFFNGVPRRGGGVRPPKNFTRLLAPQNRLLAPAEELLIEKASSITIQLPNEAVIAIQAD